MNVAQQNLPAINNRIPATDEGDTYPLLLVEQAQYSSASDYLRDLIRSDLRIQQKESSWLQDHLQARMATPNEEFVASSAADVKARVREQLAKEA